MRALRPSGVRSSTSTPAASSSILPHSTSTSFATGAARQLQQQQRLAPSRPSRSVHSCAPAAFFKSLFGGNKEADNADMGNRSSSAGWAPAADGTARKISRSGYDVTPLTRAERTQAAEALPSMSKYVTLEHGTERPFTGKTVNGVSHDSKTRGTYVCALGGLPLFSSDTKFNSGTGWPSFYAPIDPEHIIEVTDRSIAFMPRVEVLDRRSGAHLGHVFDDGPAPTGKRYCINAAALRFIPEGEPVPPESQPVA